MAICLPGKFLDEETGFYDFGQRFYDPKTGIWLSTDPLFSDTPGEAVGRPLVMSLYSYGAHNPTRFIDPDGRDTIESQFKKITSSWGKTPGIQFLGNPSPPAPKQRKLNKKPIQSTRQTIHDSGPTVPNKPSSGDILPWVMAGSAGLLGGGLAAIEGLISAGGTIASSGSLTGGGGIPPEGRSGDSGGGGRGSGPNYIIKDGKVQLFRVSGARETDYLFRFGDGYGLSDNQSGKYFSLSEKGAREFANSKFNEERQMIITNIWVPDEFIAKGYEFYDPQGGGWSLHFDDETLIELYDSMTGRPEVIDTIRIPLIGDLDGAEF